MAYSLWEPALEKTELTEEICSVTELWRPGHAETPPPPTTPPTPTEQQAPAVPQPSGSTSVVEANSHVLTGSTCNINDSDSDLNY